MDHRSNQQQQVTSGLTRYRSAPSSYFSSLLSSNNPANAAGGGGNCSYARDDFDQLLDSHVSSNDIKQVFDRFVANIGPQESDSDALIGNPRQIQQNSTSNMNAVAPMKQETDRITSVKQEMQQINEYNLASQMNYQTQAQQQNDDSTEFASGMDNFYRLLGTVDSNRSSEMKIDGLVGAGCSNSNLTRYNSSPAGLFAQVNIDNEYSAMRGRGASFSNPSRFSNQRAHTSGPGERSFGEGDKNDEDFLTGLSVPTWDDSQISTDDFLQIPEDNETEPFSNLNALDNQNSEGRARPPTLSTQMSLPQTTSELSAMEKLLQDSVPFKVRAKRGCATHPRSIAERVRRTRISERMRKLQDLVPNMDKQTNTADMLDFAADYIKELETQVKVLSERREKCTCSEEIEGDIQSFKV